MPRLTLPNCFSLALLLLAILLWALPHLPPTRITQTLTLAPAQTGLTTDATLIVTHPRALRPRETGELSATLTTANPTPAGVFAGQVSASAGALWPPGNETAPLNPGGPTHLSWEITQPTQPPARIRLLLSLRTPTDMPLYASEITIAARTGLAGLPPLGLRLTAALVLVFALIVFLRPHFRRPTNLR